MSLQLALRLARNRPLIKPRGSSSISRMVAVVSDGVSTFIGENSYRSHPMVARFSKNPDRICLHAESAAVIKALRYFTSRLGIRRDDIYSIDLSGFSIYVARVLADGSPANARPCEDCQRMLKSFNINRIEHT